MPRGLLYETVGVDVVLDFEVGGAFPDSSSRRRFARVFCWRSVGMAFRFRSALARDSCLRVFCSLIQLLESSGAISIVIYL